MEEGDVGRSGLCIWRRVMWAGQVCAYGGGDVGRSGLCGWRR